MAHLRRNFVQPSWLGEGALGGRTVLLHAEQGLGDTLQFVRYAPLVAKRGAKVLLEVQPPLVRLLSGFGGVASVFAQGTKLPAFDLQCPLMSLPLAFGTEIELDPGRIPYIGVPDSLLSKWRERLGERRMPRIGIAWAGSTAHKNNAKRSIPLDQLAALLRTPWVEFVSLQKEVSEPDAAMLPNLGNVLQLGEELGDFADTAAVIALLDLVISADTSVAHLAGAIGKPVWISDSARARFPLAARARGQPLVPDRQAVPPAPTGRLGQCPRSRALRARRLFRNRMNVAMGAPAEAESSVSTDMRRAMDLHRQGRLGEAEQCYVAILDHDREHADALHLLGLARYQQGHAIEALHLMRSALKSGPASPDVLSNYGLVLAALDQHQEALERFEEALALDRHHASALNNRGLTFAALGRAEEALASWDHALEVDPSHFESLHSRGNALYQLKCFGAALGDYERALALRSTNLDVLNNRGGALVELGRLDEALESYERALSIAPNLPVLLINKGHVLRISTNFEQALSSYAEAAAAEAMRPEAMWSRASSGFG